MSGSLTIRHAQMILPDRVVVGDLVIEDGLIVEISPTAAQPTDKTIEANGLTLLPGLIDGQVCFSLDNEETKEGFTSGCRAAAAGGVTSVIEVPSLPTETRTGPSRTDSPVHHGRYAWATPETIGDIRVGEGVCGALVHPKHIGMREHGESTLEDIFNQTQVPVHFVAEDPSRLYERHLLYPDSRNLTDHAKIFDPRTASDASSTAIALAHALGTPLHLLQLSSEEEVQLLARHPADWLTASVSLFHLLLHEDEAHTTPPIRSERHRHALWEAAKSGQITALTSGHRSVSLAQRQRPYPTSCPGVPGVEWSLSLCLDQIHRGHLSWQDLTRLWCEGPAKLHRLQRKGRLEVGFDGDVVLVDPNATHTVTVQTTHSHCGWTPWEGQTLIGKPVATVVSGHLVFQDGEVFSKPVGKALHCAH
jgi:dihydroorotase